MHIHKFEQSCACWLGALTVVLFVLASAAALHAQSAPASSGVSAPAAAAESTEPTGYMKEPKLIADGLKFANRLAGEGGGTVKNGFYPDFMNMVTGAGWISAGAGYRHKVFGDLALVDGSAAYSWRGYEVMQGRFEMPKLLNDHLTLGTQALWQNLTQVTYFGTGPDSLDEDRSEYQLKSADVTAYAIVRPVKWFSLVERGGWLHRPTIGEPAGSFKRGNPYIGVTFPDNPVFSVTQQPNYLHGETSAIIDTRDSRSHPASGGMYRATWTGYSDRDTGYFSFNRYELEGAHFVSVEQDRIVLALHGWVTKSDVASTSVVPIYLMPSLGGGNSLRAFSDYRFHDNNFAIVNAEARFAIWTHLDGAVFVDAGNVSAKFSDLNLDQRDYGVGLRMHTDKATFARVDMSHGTEGWKFIFKMNDPFHMSRLSRRTATIPFVQ